MAAPTAEDLAKWHRWFAVELNNRAWDLLEGQPERTAAEDAEMLAAAYGAWFHWHQVGTAENFARAEHLVSRAHAALGHVELATQAAERSLALAEEHDLGPWDLGCGHEVMARAAALRGDAVERARHLSAAAETAVAIDDRDSRDYLEGLLAAMPAPVSRPADAAG